jgi:hypothetical protein
MVVGQVFKDKHKILGCCELDGIEGFGRWGEEEGKLFGFPRSICLNSSLVPNVVRKLCVLRSPVIRVVLL